jgi:hypothetical protein
MGLAGMALGIVTRPLVGRWFAIQQQAAQEARERHDAQAGSGAGALNRASATVTAVLNEIHTLNSDAAALIDQMRRSRVGLAAQLGGSGSVPAQVQETYDMNERAVLLLEETQQTFHRSVQGLTRFLQRLL